MASHKEEVVRLNARVAALERQLAAVKSGKKREKVERMSAEVVDSNPYRWAPNKVRTPVSRTMVSSGITKKEQRQA